MGLQEMKKIEDLKKQLSEIVQQVYSKREIVRKKKIGEVLSDFKQFFAENDFAIEEGRSVHGSGARTIATYGDLSATIHIPPENDEYFGSITRFELEFKLPKKKEYCALLRYEPFGANLQSMPNPTVEHIEKQIANERSRLEHTEDERWYLFLKKENDNKSSKIIDNSSSDEKQYINKEYESLRDILSVIVK